jgi:hypothetical protein
MRGRRPVELVFCPVSWKPRMLWWQVSPTGGQRRFVRADAPDCVASGYWKALSLLTEELYV